MRVQLSPRYPNADTPLSIMGVFCLIYIPNLGNTITYDESITYFFSA